MPDGYTEFTRRCVLREEPCWLIVLYSWIPVWKWELWTLCGVIKKGRVYCMYDAELEGQTSDLTTCLVNAPPSRTLQTKLTFMTTKKETKYYMNVVFKVLSEISS